MTCKESLQGTGFTVAPRNLGEICFPTQVIRKLKGDIFETAANVHILNEKSHLGEG